MGFDYHVNVEVAYVQEVGYMNCYSRLATRCLKLRIDPSRTKIPKAIRKLPGEDLPQEVDDAPFSDSEEQLKTMQRAGSPRTVHEVERLHEWKPRKRG